SMPGIKCVMRNDPASLAFAPRWCADQTSSSSATASPCLQSQLPLCSGSLASGITQVARQRRRCQRGRRVQPREIAPDSSLVCPIREAWRPPCAALGQQIKQVPHGAIVVTGPEQSPRYVDHCASVLLLPRRHARQEVVTLLKAKVGPEGGAGTRDHAELPATPGGELLLHVGRVRRDDNERRAILQMGQDAIQAVGPERAIG